VVRQPWCLEVDRSAHSGSALLTVLLLMLLFSAVALGLPVVVRVELTIAARFKQSAEALYAAEAALAAAVGELRALTDWAPVLSGTRGSALSEGAFTGSKAVPQGGEVVVCCGPHSAAGRLAAETAASPLPARRSVQWQPFLWTALHALIPAEPASRLFLVVWVADDETDGDADTTSDANGVVIVRAEALAPDGLRRIVEAYIARVPAELQVEEPGAGESGEDEPPAGLPATAPGVRILAWREVR
jgi:hypothetical protein